jgi:hypothetical protein
MECPEIKYVQGDLTIKEDVLNACKSVDCVFHIAALVGPYFPANAYEAVNYGGTVNIIDACKTHKVPKLVRFLCASPSVLPLTFAWCCVYVCAIYPCWMDLLYELCLTTYPCDLFR